MTVKERIKEFIKYKKITVRAFEKDIKASNGYINSINKNIGIDKLQLIIEQNPILNLEWLLTGKGEMLASEKAEKSEKAENNELQKEINELYKDKFILLKENSELQKKYVAILEENNVLQKKYLNLLEENDLNQTKKAS
ncbi:hypothetical protein [Tenacibaculum dicentrarchi]|uniref:hypothetical protein n=1 Tax=Tenacibaculum dicentrarchi TaxID=669041 RepID=UPI0035158F06